LQFALATGLRTVVRCGCWNDPNETPERPRGIGAALLVLMPYYCKFLIPSNLAIYHLQLPLTSLIGGLLVDLLVYSALLTALLLAPNIFRR